MDKMESNISERFRRIETFFLVTTISFIGLLFPTIYSLRLELQVAMTSVREIQRFMTSMKKTSYSLSSQIEIMNERMNQYEKELKPSKKEAPKISSTIRRQGLVRTRNNPVTRPVSSMQSTLLNAKKSLAFSTEFHSRKMQLQDTTTAHFTSTCNQTLFRLELQLDTFPEETSFVLMSIENTHVVANESFSEVVSMADITFEMCLDDGHYRFIINDSAGDGIRCFDFFDGLPCYNIYIDDVLAIPGRPFQHFVNSHEFDSRSLCLVGDEVVWDLNFNIDKRQNEENHFKYIISNTQTHEEIEMLPIPDQLNGTNTTKSSFFQCLTPSIYDVEVFSMTNIPIMCEGPCYTISVNDQIIIKGNDILANAKHSFFITVDGIGHEQTCHSKPLLSPISEISNFGFDERVANILNVIQALSNTQDIFTVGTSQYRATCYILYDDPLRLQAEDPMLFQRYTLAVLLYSTNHVAEVQLALDVCINDKFNCNKQGKIKAIGLDGEGMNGFIPTEIGHLNQLENLSLDSKNLKGTIPSEIERLTKLSILMLTMNELTGSIPSVLGSLPIEKLYLHDNKLTGKIHPWFENMEALFHLELQNNFLTGTIPSELFNSKSLEFMSLSSNHLDGSIPSEIGTLQNLTHFLVSNNHLTGIIPPEIGNATLLEELNLGKNSLTGTIPIELEKIQVKLLHLEDNFLTGTMPNINVTELVYLRNNSLTGNIPESIFGSRVCRLALDDNKLMGEVPQAFCDNLTSMTSLDGMYELFVDDSTWFLDEALVACPCCSDKYCHMWKNNDVIIVGGTRKPSCPPSNVFKQVFFENFIIRDDVANVSHFEMLGEGVEVEMDLCLSPTGCFSLMYDESHGRDDWTLSWDTKYKVGYSSTSKTLQEHDTCNAVDVCGVSIGPDHPKRIGLNHLTHIVLPDLSILDNPSLPQYKALCWIMTQDQTFHDYDVCDGTLLQRYIMIFFYYSFEKAFDFYSLGTDHTCGWPGVTCDPFKKYIEHLDFSDKGLEGSLVSEIGLLTRLKTFTLSHNSLAGTIEPAMFEYLPDLEVFDVSFNEIGGRIPKTLLQLPRIEDIVLSNNFMMGELPDDIKYSDSIKKFDVENNLFASSIPAAFMACSNLEVISLSRNNFEGNIPSDFSLLRKMREIKLYQNALSGSIPKEIFNLKNLERFEVQSNFLIGMIPTEIGKCESATFISLSHNFLKGTIPKEIENLQKIQYLHLYDNFLTGAAPHLPKLKELGKSTGELERYITDCGDPSFLLANPIDCPSCTLCCNSNKMCQENKIWQLSVEKGAFIAVFGVPMALIVIFYLVGYGSKAVYERLENWDERDVLRMVDENSTYCLVFSDSYVAWVIYIIVYFLQGCFYYMFLLASSFSSDSSDWQFTYQCSSSNGSCDNESSVNVFGWIMFYVVTLFTLSVDYINSAQLILKSVAKFNLRMFFGGFLHLSMTVLALFCSFYYNMALATTNTELIVNAVILLFVNDLDEQLMNAIYAFAPKWVDRKIEEIKNYLTEEGRRTRRRESVLPNWAVHFTERTLSIRTLSRTLSLKQLPFKERKLPIPSPTGMDAPQADSSQGDIFVDNLLENGSPAIETVFVRVPKDSSCGKDKNRS